MGRAVVRSLSPHTLKHSRIVYIGLQPSTLLSSFFCTAFATVKPCNLRLKSMRCFRASFTLNRLLPLHPHPKTHILLLPLNTP